MDPPPPQVCLVGKSRNYQPSDDAEAESRRARYIQSHRAAPPSDGGGRPGDKDADGDPGGGWGAGFQPRERVEAVRNCAALPRDLVDGVVLQVANALLGMAEDDPGATPTGWNEGGKPPPPQATKHLSQK